MKIIEFKLPDLGEGLPDAEVVTWYVQVGQQIEADQPLVAVETAKAVIDLPAPVTGKVIELCVAGGKVVATGAILVKFAVADPESTAPEPESTEPEDAYLKVNENFLTLTASVDVKLDPQILKSPTRILAVPAARALAKKLNFDLSKIKPTREDQLITVADLTRELGNELEKSNLEIGKARSISKISRDPKDDSWQLLHTAARSMALTMQSSAVATVAATIMEDLLLPLWAPEKFDLTVELISAIAFACRQEPILNSWFLEEQGNFYQKIIPTINLGVAVDHPQGLFVPVLADIASNAKEKLRADLDQILQQVKLDPFKLPPTPAATFILSNFGKFGGSYATPVVIPPMVGILAVGRARQVVVPENGELQIRQALPISLSFDHRAVTGGQAARFLQGIMEFFSIS